jgi:diacylglycerol kinase family enzyme
MRVTIISNPIAGRPGQRAALLEMLQRKLSAAGFSPELALTKCAGDAIRLAAEAPADCGAIVSVGGDGTLRECVQGLAGRAVPVAVYPLGTENVLAKHFGIKASVERLIATLRQGRAVAYDVGVCGDYRFVLLAGVGFDATVVRRVAEARRGHISYLSYFRPAWRTYWDYHYPAVRVEVDGREVYTGRALVWAGVIPRYSLGTRILHRARVDDELLDVCILPCASRMRILGYAGRLLLHRPLVRGDGLYHQGQVVRISAPDGEPVDVQIDGDPAGRLPIECRVIPAGVRLLLPPEE